MEKEREIFVCLSVNTGGKESRFFRDLKGISETYPLSLTVKESLGDLTGLEPIVSTICLSHAKIIGTGIREGKRVGNISSFTGDFQGQLRARESVRELLKNKKTSERSQAPMKFKKGPKRVEITYRYNTGGQPEQQMVVLEFPEDEKRIKGRVWQGSSLIEYPREVSLMYALVTSVAYVPQDCEEATPYRRFENTTNGCAAALKHLKRELKFLKDEEKAELKLWRPSGSTPQVGNTYPRYTSHQGNYFYGGYSATVPTTYYRVSGDEEGRKAVLKQKQKLTEGKGVVDLG